jgi:putative transposase
MAVNTDGRREVLGKTIGHSEAEPFWVDFLRSLTRRGLRCVKLVVSDAHDGLKAAITKRLSATWQRCRVHFMRNAIARGRRSGALSPPGWAPRSLRTMRPQRAISGAMSPMSCVQGCQDSPP